MTTAIAQRPAFGLTPTTATFGTVILAAAVWFVLDPSLWQVWLQWLPYLGKGFAMNVLISVLAIALGTLAGVAMGIMELSSYRLVRAPALIYVQIFRNAPHLVLIFAATYTFPFELVIFGNYVPFPDWIKAVVGLAIPASAHIAEITRGSIQSIPTRNGKRRRASASRACNHCAGSSCRNASSARCRHG